MKNQSNLNFYFFQWRYSFFLKKTFTTNGKLNIKLMRGNSAWFGFSKNSFVDLNKSIFETNLSTLGLGVYSE